MKKIYSGRLLIYSLLIAVLLSCHEDPTIPASAIPITCQVSSIANINETIRDTVYYQYTPFGHISESLYKQWYNNQLIASTKQQYTYSTDHYLLTQLEQNISNLANAGQTQVAKLYTYTYQGDLLQQVTIADAQSKAILGYKLYTYENGSLKTYSETNAQKVSIRSYTFDESGKLTQLTEAGLTAQISNGKIMQKLYTDGTSVKYAFDPEGQLVNEVVTSATSRSERTYTYDKNPNWSKTQLVLRGVPSPDLGGHSAVHNIATSGIRVTQNDRLVQDQLFTYQYQYNKANYSLGYSRSDGYRQRISYANCL